MSIIVIGLGPSDSQLLTREAWQLLQHAERLYLRTEKHPVVAELPDHIELHSFDHLYEEAADFQQLYADIVTTLIQLGQEAAAKGEQLLYAVPGHPYVGEATVTGLRQKASEAGIPIKIVEGLSFLEPTLTAIGVDALAGLQIFDALDIARAFYPPLLPDQPLLLGQVYSRGVASELKLNLMRLYPDEHPVVLIHAAGSDAEKVEYLPLYKIDWSETTSYLTSLYVPPLPEAATVTRFAATVAILRSPDGCPWDQEQTPQSLRAGLLEECAELLDALDQDDPDAVREELGDLLLHILMQAQMGSEEELFTLTEVVQGIDQKIKYRHPHVWGDVEVADSDEVIRNWGALKAAAKPAAENPTLLANIPISLPALARSRKIQRRVTKVGFDWPDIEGVWAKINEEIAEIHAAETAVEQQMEIGDLLFAVTRLADWLDIEAETALREANLRFMRRFQLVEQLAAAANNQLADLTIAELEALWQEAKRQTAASG